MKGQEQPEGSAKSSDLGTSTPNGKFSLISDEKLIGLYTDLLKCRAMDRLSDGSPNGKQGSLRGCEAALVGTAIDLVAGDLVCFLDRGLVANISDGNALGKLLIDSGHNGRPELPTAKQAVNGRGAIEMSFAHAAIGAALANKTAKNGKIAVVYSSKASSDSVREAIHIASVHALPIIFVQHWEGDLRRGDPVKKGNRRNTDADSETPWFPTITVDTNDVVAVYRVANEALSRGRLGRGLTVIECQPFLLTGGNRRHHADPVRNMESYLRAKGLFDPELKRETAELRRR